ncbi:MAG TPA: sensor histidine kinase [Symbiobacteriaceae bacterium]|jgi:signal transduction histidine kinase
MKVMIAIRMWLIDNIVIVRFVYGLSFFSLALVISIQPRLGSRYRLARRLWALAVFALIHALADWGLVFIPLQARPDQSITVAALWGARTILGAVSFGFLMHFGLGLLVSGRSRVTALALSGLAPALTVIWLLAFFFYPLVYQDSGLNTWYWVSEVWSRYMLGLPSGLIVAFGLLRQGEDLRRDQLHRYLRDLYLSAGFFALYGLTAGLVVPSQAFWPASFLNTEMFVRTVGIPVEVFRGLTAIGIVFATIRLMSVFSVETTRRIFQSEEERATLRERERIARELHDGILQTLYGVGLGLGTLNKRLTKSDNVEATLAEITTQLSGAIWDLRHAITDLHQDQVPLLSLASTAHDYIGQYSRVTGLPVTFSTEGFEGPEAGVLVPTAFRKELLALIREGLSNAARHSQASLVTTLLALQDETVLLRIEDNGVGFSPVEVLGPDIEGGSSHNGLRNMRYRTERLGGAFRVESSPGHGTRLLFQIPLPETIWWTQRTAEEASRP